MGQSLSCRRDLLEPVPRSDYAFTCHALTASRCASKCWSQFQLSFAPLTVGMCTPASGAK